MTFDAQQVLLILGYAGGRAPVAASCFSSLSSGISECEVAGWINENGGYYLMGVVGENALAISLMDGTSTPSYTPSLDFSNPDNSQYAPTPL